MPFFPYGQKEMEHLTRRCPKMGELIGRLGLLERPVQPDPFQALVTSVLAQQISSKGAATVCARFQALAGRITPERVAALSVQDIQGCGTSMRKAEYIKGIAGAAQNGVIDFAALASMPDAEVVRRLSCLRGVGVWTAEMLLIFSLCRPDVVSWLDLGIRKGMMALYGKKTLSPRQFAVYRKRYAPFGSVASFYLWALAGQ
ncbi:MAG: DNA-3-methyladenine glycosylase 2 family protein [Desulfovibrionaceae bacterium]|nr:DNA-3-methyladenine glycosylase 2 family protein [Desulfovibrionaceae bacterium]